MRLQYFLTAFVACAITFAGTSVNAATPEKPATIAARAAAAHIISPGKLITTCREGTVPAGSTNATTTSAPAATGKPAAKSPVKLAAHKLRSAKQSTVKVAAKGKPKQPTDSKLTSAPPSTSVGATGTLDSTKMAPQTATTPTACGTPSLPSMQPLNAVVNTAPVNSSEAETKLHPAAVTPNESASSHPMVLTPAPAYEVATMQDKSSGKMSKFGGWFNQRVLRRGPAPSQSLPPATMQAGPANCATSKPAASPYLIASESTSTVTYWPPTSTNVAVHNYGPMSEKLVPGATTSAIPSEMRPAILIVKLAPGVYPAAIGGVIDRVHGSVMGSHGAEYMHTLRIAINRNDVPLAMKLLTNNKSVQYVVPEELLGIAGANK